MLRSWLVGLMLIQVACNWPPFEGPADGSSADSQVDPILGCGREWTDITPKLAGPLKPLRGVFATASTVYAVGESGTVLTMAAGAPPAACTITGRTTGLDDGILYSVSASDSSLYVAGEKGIYQSRIASSSVCLADIDSGAKPCSDLWMTGDSGFAACDAQIRMKRSPSSSWESLQALSNNQFFVVSSPDLLISGGAFGNYDVADLPSATWRMPSPLLVSTPALRDGWYSGVDLCVVGDSRFYSCFDSVARKIPDSSSPPLIPDPTVNATFLSLWNKGGNTYIAGSEKNLKVASFQTGTVWRNSSATEPILTKDDYIFHAVYGYGKNVYVVGRRLLDAAYVGVIFCQSVGG